MGPESGKTPRKVQKRELQRATSWSKSYEYFEFKWGPLPIFIIWETIYISYEEELGMIRLLG